MNKWSVRIQTSAPTYILSLPTDLNTCDHHLPLYEWIDEPSYSPIRHK